MSLVGRPDGPPTVLGGHVVYAASGLYVGVATALALLQQQLSGRGTTTTVSVLECLESLMEQAMIEYTFSGNPTERRGSGGQITATSGAFPCKDGYFMISVGGQASNWFRFAEWLADPDLADPALAAEEKRQEKRDLIQDRIRAWSRDFAKDELVTEAQKRHLPASPVATPLDLTHDPQLVARGFLTPLEHPLLGNLLFPRGAIATVFDRPIAAAPRLGEHNPPLLAELGYSPAEQASLVEGGTL
jgi:crotonobetainyl-CoA:carnitine CoA-transferase CaiB-like acyl-CoA transferase